MSDSIIDQAVDAIELALQFEYEGHQYPAAKRAAQALADANLLRPEIDDAMIERASRMWAAQSPTRTGGFDSMSQHRQDLIRNRMRPVLESALGGEQE